MGRILLGMVLGAALVLLLFGGIIAVRAQRDADEAAARRQQREALAYFLDPCRSVRQAVIERGSLYTWGGARLQERAWFLLLPLLHEVPWHDELATDPGAVRQRVRALLETSPQGYATTGEAQRAVAELQAVAEWGQAAVARGETVAPGVHAIMALFADLDRVDAWRATASVQAYATGWPRQSLRSSGGMLRNWDEVIRREYGRGADLVVCV